MFISKLMLHPFEEEPISGIRSGFKGTFAIFFYGCNMECLFCQNNKISKVKIDMNFIETHKDFSYVPNVLVEKILEAEMSNAFSISFITGALYVDLICETIKLAKAKNLSIPIVYNTNGYESVANIKKLNGLIDIYLPDFKYFDNTLSYKFSKRNNYFEVAVSSLDEMYSQIGKTDFTKKRSGIIVRHLVLPGHTEDSIKILKFLYDKYGNDICYSIMSQYTPINKNIIYDELNRKLTKREYNKVINYAIDLGIENAFIQEGDVARETFIPEFNE